MDDEEGACLCGYCGAQRGLLYCPQHAARLCLPCDMIVHDAALTHERAPLCNGCHAAPAAAYCSEHQAALCAPCAGSARCAAEQHHQRPARTFTGCPEGDDLARILSGDGTPEPADACWVPDLVNMELPSELVWDGTVSSSEVGSANRTPSHFIKNGHLRHMSDEPVPMLVMYDTPDRFKGGGGDSLSSNQVVTEPLTTELLMPQDCRNLNDGVLHDLDFAAQGSSPIGHVEGAFEASSSLGYDHTSCSETVLPSDAVLQSLTSNTAAACQFSTDTTGNVNFRTGDMTVLLPDEVLIGTGLPPGPPAVGSSMGYQDHEPPEKDMEASMKQREKRQQAKQRYNDKKKNRRFGKQIMYESRKARADTRNRVKGRFAKSSSNSDQI